MYCGNCLRDNALVAELRRLGHETLMLPLYLPLTLDEENQSAGTPIFFGGINVYFEQKFRWFRHAPNWLRSLLASPALLSRAAGASAKTRPEDVGEILLSMLRGEEGNQLRELDALTTWLRDHARPDVMCLSNALLLGMAKRLKQDVGGHVVCMLQGEDTYLDSLVERYREEAWDLVRQKCADVDLFVAPNHYFADLMTRRLRLPPDKVHVVRDGIRLEGYATGQDSAVSVQHGTPACDASPTAEEGRRPPTLGYFARMCEEKGLGLLVDAFIQIRRRGHVPDLHLTVGGGCGPGDEPFVATVKRRLSREGLSDAVSFHPNLSKSGKIRFLRSLDVFSVPAIYAEAFGLYVVEANAAGVPVVAPDAASFPELLESTGGGVLCQHNNVASLADQIEALLRNPERRQALGRAGQRSVFEKYSSETMARTLLHVLETAFGPTIRPASPA